ncbi:MAG: isochorismatase family protein [Burkholderiales bacterium]|nr:isochorismatase family protein [Burkholderiales bacterium]
MNKNMVARQRKLCELFGIEMPIFVWPSLAIQSAELVAKASETGALGILAAGFMDEKQIEQAVKDIRALTNRPFAVQIFPPQTTKLNEKDFQFLSMGLAPVREDLGLTNPDVEVIKKGINFEGQWKVLLDLQVPIIGLCLGGLREPYMYTLKERGIKTFGGANNLLDAKGLTSSGVDALVAQSWGSSGLRSFNECPEAESRIDGLVLLQEMARAARIPVLADCVLFTKAAVRTAMELGSSGLVLRDQLSNAVESKLPATIKESLPYMTTQSSVVSQVPFGVGRPARVLNTAIYETLLENELPILDFPFQYLALKDIFQAALDEEMPELMCLEASQLLYLVPKGSVQSLVQNFYRWIRMSKQALIVVDVQNDFLETGALPVKDGSKVIPVINQLLPKFDSVVVTQDWHPNGHISYASSHGNKQPYETVEVSYGTQALWPDHCKAGTKGAELADGLALTGKEYRIKKGTNAGIDCYSAVKDAAGQPASDLLNWLSSNGIEEVYVCGLATDFCVCETAIDIAKGGFKTFIVTDASRPVNVNGSLEDAKRRWEETGVKTIESKDVPSFLN